MTQRQIKFRAWNNRKCAWVDHNEFLNEPDVSATVLPPSIFKFTHNDWLIQQFTGLNDCKGQEIYEGDILKAFPKSWDGRVSEISEYNALCFWDVCGFNFKLIPETYHHGRCVDWYGDEFEIIGNQFENPELLNDQ